MDCQNSVGFVILAAQARFKGTNPRAEFPSDFTDPSNAKEQDNNDEDDREFCGA